MCKVGCSRNSNWYGRVDGSLALCAGPPAAEQGVGKDLVRAALAGGIASSTSTLVLHPLDTLKTRIQVRLCLE